MHRLAVGLSVVLITFSAVPAAAQGRPSVDSRLTELEERLRAVSEDLQTILREINSLKNERLPTAVDGPATSREATATHAPSQAFDRQVLGRDTGPTPETSPLNVKPDIFLETRFSAFPLEDTTLGDYEPNFRVTRANVRWAGRVNEKMGAGVELHYRAAPDGVPEQLLNDAYLEFYLKPALTIRAGQFVKPFGFDVQQRDSERESPERAMFAGYLFPGERDRGLMLMGDLSTLCENCSGLEYAAAVVNGNRFFRDSNRQVNVLFRVRKVQKGLAFGVSTQLGTQITPPDVEQTNDENVFGADVQWSVGRLGLRGEFAHGNRPATLLALDPEFAPAFVEGARVRTVGSSVTGLWSLSQERQLYVRFDRLAGDTVMLCPQERDGSCKINAVNGGLRQRVGDRGCVEIDLQWKNRLSFNHDAVNTRFQVTSSLLF